jgi:hypothetical protein
MTFRLLALPLAALALCAAAPPPPAALEPYVVDGEFRPGDYRFVKGRFEDATDEDKADSSAIALWATRCMEDARAQARTRLAAMGYPEARLEFIPMGPLLCRQATMAPYLPELRTYAAYVEQVRQAAPIADAFLSAVALAEVEGGPRGPDLADQLLARTLGEQMVRHGFSWGRGVLAGKSPELSPAALTIVRSRLGWAMAAYDTANTEWLKGVVAEHGWPKVSEVGELAAKRAWLLVQHADHDPVFQLEALRLMEPLVAQREVSPNDFAYLTDRVMLKLTGKQRYGTQFQCVDGQHTPQAVEDEAAVDRLRAAAGMETQAANTARMRETYGPCQNPPVPAPSPSPAASAVTSR